MDVEIDWQIINKEQKWLENQNFNFLWIKARSVFFERTTDCVTHGMGPVIFGEVKEVKCLLHFTLCNFCRNNFQA